MTYSEALQRASFVGASHAKGDADLAQTVAVLSQAHAINPEMTYNAARKRGLSGRDLAKMAHDDVMGFAFLQFDE